MNEFDGYGNGDNLFDPCEACRPHCRQSDTAIFCNNQKVGKGYGIACGNGTENCTGYSHGFATGFDEHDFKGVK